MGNTSEDLEWSECGLDSPDCCRQQKANITAYYAVPRSANIPYQYFLEQYCARGGTDWLFQWGNNSWVLQGCSLASLQVWGWVGKWAPFISLSSYK